MFFHDMDNQDTGNLIADRFFFCYRYIRKMKCNMKYVMRTFLKYYIIQDNS